MNYLAALLFSLLGLLPGGPVDSFKSAVEIVAMGAQCKSQEEADDTGCTIGEVKEMGHGSGVILGPNTIATAGHIVDSLKQLDTGWLEVHTQDGKVYRVTKVERSTERDFAIVTVEETLSSFVAISCEKVTPGEHLWVVGYPLDFGLQSFEVIAVNYYKDAKQGWVLLADGVSLPGNSGGPVYNVRGELVGFLVGEYMYSNSIFGDATDTDLNIVIPSLYTVCSKELSS